MTKKGSLIHRMGYGGKLPKLPGRTVWFNGYNVLSKITYESGLFSAREAGISAFSSLH